MTSPELLSALPTEKRNNLEKLLLNFDQSWSPELLTSYIARLDSDADESYQRVVVSELSKIDIQRCWSNGEAMMLEEYLERFPLIGNSATVDPELIFVEFEARKRIDANVSLESYAARFPAQYEKLVQLASRQIDSHKVPLNCDETKPKQASVETSRIGNITDTKTPSKNQPPELPIEFGRYRILRELGSGAMGKVHLAHDTQLDRQVALKTPNFKADDSDEMVTRFYREARAAAKIQHRNICPIYDVGEIDGQHFITMAFIKGRTMSEFIGPDKLPPTKTSAILVLRLALALAEAHRHNVIHRDLKPANIMIDMKREPVVMDFGLARQTDVESRMTQSGMLLGTPAYMSPEQLSGDPDDTGIQADIYALGVILYELLTGKLPFNGSLAQVVAQILKDEPKAPSTIRDQIPQELEIICGKMMAKECSSRFQTMDEVADAIKSYLASPTETPLKSDTVAKTSNPRKSVSETGVLNEFFAAQTAGDPSRTSIEPLPAVAPNSEALKINVSTSQSTKQSSPNSNPDKGRSNSNSKWIAAGLGGVILIAAILGILFYFKTPHGTIRVETFGDLDGLEVLVDGNIISLVDSKRAKAAEHQLELKLDGTRLKLDPTKNQFIASKVGNERRLSVSVGDVQLASRSFTVAKNKETIIKIELLSGGGKTAEKTNDDKEIKIAKSNGKNSGGIGKAAANPSRIDQNPTKPDKATNADRISETGTPNSKPSSNVGSLSPFTIHSNADMKNLILSPDGKKVAATGRDTPGQITIWSAETGEQLNRITASQDGGIWKFAFSPDGNSFLISSGRYIKVVKSSDGTFEKQYEFPSSGVVFRVFPKRNWAVGLYREFAQSKAEQKAKSVPQYVRIWNLETGETVAEQKVYDGTNGFKETYWPSISPDEKFLTLGVRHNHIRYEIVTDGDSVTLTNQTALESTALVRGPLVFSNDGRFAATTMKNGKALFAVLDFQSGRVHRMLDRERSSNAGEGGRLAFAPDGRRIAVSDLEGGISVWNCETGELIKRMHSHTKEAAKFGAPGIAITSDNRVITSGGSSDRTIVISPLPTE